MKDSQVMKSWSEAVATRNLLLLSNVIMAGVLAVLVLAYIFSEPKIIAVTENEVYGELSVHGDKANQNFQQAWAYSVSNLIGNLNPRNIGFVKKALMRVLSPRLQVEIEPMLDRQAELIKMRDIRQVFIAEDMIHDPDSDLITIWGQKLTFIKGEPKADSKWSYEFKVEVRKGLPRIVHIDQYPGTPRKRKEAMAAREQAGAKEPTSQPYYDQALEVGALEAAAELQVKEEIQGESND